MADLNKLETRVALKEEVTEGTYVAPTAATDYIQPLEDFVGFSPSKELVERNILRSGLGQITPRVGLQRAEAGLAVEFRASGSEGDPTDFHFLLKNGLGSTRNLAARITTKAAPAHTTTVLQIEDADIANLNVGDGIVVLDSTQHQHVVIVSKTSGVGTATITVAPTMSEVPEASVQIAKFTTYYGASSGSSIPGMSLTAYLGNGGISQRVAGLKVSSMSIDNFTAGQIASFNFSLNGMSFDEVLESAPHTPTFDSGVPPLILRACLFQNGTELGINNFSLNLSNTITERTTTCNANGITGLRLTEREVTGTFDPYKSDSSTGQFDNFNDNTPYSLIILAGTRNAAGTSITLGSAISIYLPNCITTEFAPADLNNVIQDAISFAATGGNSGSDTDIYISMT